jgi:hypothetical protein
MFEIGSGRGFDLGRIVLEADERCCEEGHADCVGRAFDFGRAAPLGDGRHLRALILYCRVSRGREAGRVRALRSWS